MFLCGGLLSGYQGRVSTYHFFVAIVYFKASKGQVVISNDHFLISNCQGFTSKHQGKVSMYHFSSSDHHFRVSNDQGLIAKDVISISKVHFLISANILIIKKSFLSEAF